MRDDPIVEEVHRWREELIAQFNGDLHALAEAVRQGTEAARKAGHPVFVGKPRPPQQSGVSPIPAKKVG